MRKNGPVILTILDGWGRRRSFWAEQASTASRGMRSTIFATLVLLVVPSGSWAQQTVANPFSEPPYVPTLTFDVASVHESLPADSYVVGGQNSIHRSEVNLTNMDMMNLLSNAYGVNRAQVLGLPDWLIKEKFDVQAKSDDAADNALAKLDNHQALMEKQHMFQFLLADRFQLKIHWETRKGQIYELLVSKKGSKLQAAGSIPPSAEELKNFGDRKPPPIYQRGNGLRGYEYVGHNCSIESLASALTMQMGTSVIDKTGLTGGYDFILQYHGAKTSDANDNPDIWPALDTAVPDQLGLKLESSTGDKTFLVVDHVEKLSAN